MTVLNASRGQAEVVQYPFYNNGVDNDVMVVEYVNHPSNWVRIKPGHTYSLTPFGSTGIDDVTLKAAAGIWVRWNRRSSFAGVLDRAEAQRYQQKWGRQER
jgi:hypothetical protein